MSTPFEAIAELDRVVHEPARLAILSALSACASADFVFLQRITGLSKGNLSSHLSKLEDAGLVSVVKAFAGRTPRTTVAITDDGRGRIEAYWRDLERLGRAARRWRPA
ncbi:MAG TPA: transcriptional regulator [Streptosporangiaceae bacterium]|jgi:DNA-binding transcriptional ArsR family regulator